MKMMFIIVAVVLLGTSGTEAKDLVTWVRIHYPPFLIIDGDQAAGLGIDIENVLRENMPEYEHTAISSNIKRLHTLLEEGNCCGNYLIRTPAVEEKYYFSTYPTLITPTHRIVALKKNRQQFGEGERLSLKRLLEKPELRLGITAARSYSKELDDILKPYEGAPNIYVHRSSTSVEGLIQMLVAGRIDYLIEYPPMFQYVQRQLGVTDEFSVYVIEEKVQRWTTGWVGCTKNEWGKRVIEKVDTILPRYIPTEPFYQAASRLVDPHLFPDFRDVYFKEMTTPQPQNARTKSLEK